AGVPTPSVCMKAADCGTGKACDIATHECIAGVISMDETSFVSDGTRLWTDSDQPTLHGLYVGPTSAIVEVAVGSGPWLMAELQNTSSWTIHLPSGSLTAADTTVRVMLTDPSGMDVELSRVMALDNIAPRIALASSIVRDERGDSIAFSTGEPVHTHAGAQIDLGAQGCPVV